MDKPEHELHPAIQELSQYSSELDVFKRPRLEDIYHAPEKRQRKTMERDDKCVIHAKASAAIKKHFGPPGQRGGLSVSMEDPHLHMRILSLPILESLSRQIIGTLGHGPCLETMKITTDPNSEHGQAYSPLKSLFDQTKKMYSQQACFISANDLNMTESSHKATIRIANLATFVSSIFAGHAVLFYDLHDHFIDIFTPDGVPLQKEPAQLFINFKSQMYLSTGQQEEQQRPRTEDILEELFPLAVGETLLLRHPEMSLSQSELDFIADCKSRREELLNASNDIYSIQALSEKYTWENFLESLLAYLKTAYAPLIKPFMRRQTKITSIPARKNMGHHYAHHKNAVFGHTSHDVAAAADEAVQAKLTSFAYVICQRQTRQVSRKPRKQLLDSLYRQENDPASHGNGAQTGSTKLLYNQGQQAVAVTQPTSPKRPRVVGQRSPWSTEEEMALMAGLDAVKGNHWSAILSLYGPGGTISDVLKDRNQVQLKDKARNLKLFFLKSEAEVPDCLQNVTGELKTRAPSQAAKKEKRAWEKYSQEYARSNDLMARASHLYEKQTND
ncbi:telomere repeat binding factor-domain-containing protein [Bisporella sp. PMI_857]|nr:telomere repeat binding factor-domain-containing protein [Bisporella sp. PMI_857]